MKLPSRVLSAGLGAILIAGSMFVFTGRAQAAPGDLLVEPTSTITLGPFGISLSGSGAGVTGSNVGPWNGTMDLTGTYSCLEIAVSVPDDTISWDGANTGTQVMAAGTTITMDSTACSFPPQGVCVITLNTAKTLTTAVGGFPLSGDFRDGTFVAATTIGNYTLTEGTNCYSSGLASQIAYYFGNPGGTPPYTATSSATFDASLLKSLELPHVPRGDLVVAPTSTIALGFISTTLGGTGAGVMGANVSPWNGALNLTGTAGTPCLAAALAVSNDTISWNGANTGTQVMAAGTTITIDSTACSFPPQGVCVITLNTAKTLTTTVGGFPLSGEYRDGTFTATTTIGNYALTEGTNCYSSGLANYITASFGNPVPTGPLPYTNTTAAVFTASLIMSLKVLP